MRVWQVLQLRVVGVIILQLYPNLSSMLTENKDLIFDFAYGPYQNIYNSYILALYCLLLYTIQANNIQIMQKKVQFSGQTHQQANFDNNQVWEQILFWFTSNYLIQHHSKTQIKILQKNDNPKNRLNSCISFKRKTDAIYLQVSAFDKLSCNMGYFNGVEISKQICNKLCKDQIVYWNEENKNFSIRKVILSLGVQIKTQDILNFVNKSIQQMQLILAQCINLLTSEKKKGVGKQKKSKTQYIQKKLDIIQKLRFQFQLQRRKRKNATTIDFNMYKIKTYEEIYKLRQRCVKNSENYMQKLKQNFVKNNIVASQALRVYNKYIQQFTKQKNEDIKSQSQSKLLKILYGIQLQQVIEIQNQKINGTFAHITVIQSVYRIVLSLNSKTNEYMKNIITGDEDNKIVSEQHKQTSSEVQQKNEIQKKRKSILIRKSKCLGCDGETEQRIKQNQTVFQNQIRVLLNMKNCSHSSICNYYIQQVNQTHTAVEQLYSVRYPYTSVSKFGTTKDNKNTIKYLMKLLRFLYEVAQGIYFLQKNFILHRDLKPANICLDLKQNPKIIDFGSACPIFMDNYDMDKCYSEQKLRSTQGYYFNYNNLPAELIRKYMRNNYERHPSFDVYSLGRITEQFLPSLKSSNNKYFQMLVGNIEYFLKKSKDIHPDDRLTVIQASMFLKQLSELVNVMCQENI